MTSSSQFRPLGPPALTGAWYAADYNEVKALGAAIGSTRTAEQSLIALFWADGASTETPPGHWNSIAQSVAAAQGNTLEENARFFALLNVAMADADIHIRHAAERQPFQGIAAPSVAAVALRLFARRKAETCVAKRDALFPYTASAREAVGLPRWEELPRWAKSAARIDGASFIVVLSMI